MSVKANAAATPPAPSLSSFPRQPPNHNKAEERESSESESSDDHKCASATYTDKITPLTLSLENLETLNQIDSRTSHVPVTPGTSTSCASRMTTFSSRELQTAFDRGPVKEWLYSIERKQYAKIFKKHKIWSLEMVECLTEQDLQPMGITGFNLTFMLKKIGKLKERNTGGNTGGNTSSADWRVLPQVKEADDEDRISGGSQQWSSIQLNGSGTIPSPAPSPTHSDLEYKRKAHKKLSSRQGSGEDIIFNQPGKWDIFISYTQRNGDARVLSERLANSFEQKNLKVWLDKRMDVKSTLAMQEGVENSECVIAIITGACIDTKRPNTPKKENAYFQRDYCRKEMEWAKAAGVNIHPVCNRDDVQIIGELRDGCPDHLQFIFDEDITYLDESKNSLWNVGVDEIIDRMSLGGGSTAETRNASGCGSCVVT